MRALTPVPIINLEVSNMKHTMRLMLTEHAARLDQSIQQAVEEFCTEDNIGRIVRTTAKEALNAAVKEEVLRFFSYGENGRQAVREAVLAFLDEVYPLKGSE